MTTERKRTGAKRARTAAANVLQQSTAFRPFMGQFVFLQKVTSFAGNNEIVRMVSSAACNRYNMIDMIFTADFFMAVVAFVMLPFKLILNDTSSMVDKFAWLSGNSVMPTLSKFFSPFIAVHSTDFPGMQSRTLTNARTSGAISTIVNVLKIIMATCANLYRHNAYFTRYSAENQGRKPELTV